MTKKQVIVIGGGASGMMAAITARRLGAQVTILERNARVGKKLLATGNGRCNYTNINIGISCYHGANPGFARYALTHFTVEDALAFFKKLGIEPKVEEEGKVFPMSEQASSVLDVMRYELEESGVNTVCEALVKSIEPSKEGFLVEIDNGQVYKADRVILAAGGKAMPASGSDGRGYDLAQQLGHRTTDIFPALVQIMLEGPNFKRIEGVKINGTAEIIHNNRSVAIDRGDILFANYGVSGPPILQLSRKAAELLRDMQEVYLKINMLDSMSKEELLGLLTRRLQNAGAKTIEFSLVGLINKRLIPVVLMEAGIEKLKRRAVDMKAREIDELTRILTDWRFKIRGTKGWNSAQVTAGGVDISEIDPDTMESRLIPGLYFCGEMIDIDGKCGGYNLQWAWSSGFVAGQSAAL
ncbi:MAG TPA: NAD(P)/FAD-dependent oxidoreductase [Syntrophomonadaceae bacterium]|jgi:predicted Rossmann fold flavoprotein|nr:NAD(P)/FAD-dependent oxidoreductase [Syntrophomonadaceae bacterium]HRX20911.1 NAD(P)/FAD-dependent oxidoreductase [Syntrophomonadaceae bacterium]